MRRRDFIAGLGSAAAWPVVARGQRNSAAATCGAHRLSTVRRTNRIITFDGGRIVEDGPHDNLINTGGRYASLYRLQAGVHEVE